MVVIMNLYHSLDLELIIPTKSMAHMDNGQGETIM